MVTEIMGIIHFAGLGKSPGAVTTGLSYLKNEVGDAPEYGKVVEGVVIFTSPEILEGREKAYPSVDNEYMTKNVRKRWPEGIKSSIEIVSKFLHREFKGGEFYACEVDVNDFSECFKVVVKALLKFHPPGKVGKHIWANLTGGTNVLNMALTQAAYLSGLIPILYYTFVANSKEDGKYLRPFSRNKSEFDFRKIYVVKTRFDERYRYIYEELERCEGWISSSDLLNRLKRNYLEFQEMNLVSFRRDFLNTMHGIKRAEKQDLNRLDEDGKEILKILRSPLFKALTRENFHSPDEIRELVKDLKMKKI